MATIHLPTSALAMLLSEACRSTQQRIADLAVAVRHRAAGDEDAGVLIQRLWRELTGTTIDYDLAGEILDVLLQTSAAKG